jgi:hypothetical protein
MVLIQDSAFNPALRLRFEINVFRQSIYDTMNCVLYKALAEIDDQTEF